jgi:hypothetical protein
MFTAEAQRRGERQKQEILKVFSASLRLCVELFHFELIPKLSIAI